MLDEMTSQNGMLQHLTQSFGIVRKHVDIGRSVRGRVK